MPSVGLLGDSTTAVTYLPASNTWETLLRKALLNEVAVSNYADDGAKTEDALNGTGGHPGPSIWLDSGAHDAYLIRYGFNEDNLAAFETDTTTLVNLIKNAGKTPILVTNYGVDFANGHYSFDRDTTIEQYNAVYRNLATSLGCQLYDMWATFQRHYSLGRWDYRLRRYQILGRWGAFRWGNEVYGGKGLSNTSPEIDIGENQIGGASKPASLLDGDGYGGDDLPLWFTEIHPNSAGCRLIADEMELAIRQSGVFPQPPNGFSHRKIRQLLSGTLVRDT